jgi:DNA-binding response OmpR family regulator
LSVYIARLRKKLETIRLPDYIETKKGVGYMVK